MEESQQKTIIRYAKQEDILQIIQLCKIHSEYEDCEYSSEKKAEKLTKALFYKKPSLYCLIAEIENEIIGYLTYTIQFSTWDVSNYIYMDCLFLKEKVRGFNIGEQLINKIKEEGKKLDCNLIQWQTPEINIKAIKFYNRIGAESRNKKRFYLEI